MAITLVMNYGAYDETIFAFLLFIDCHLYEVLLEPIYSYSKFSFFSFFEKLAFNF